MQTSNSTSVTCGARTLGGWPLLLRGRCRQVCGTPPPLSVASVACSATCFRTPFISLTGNKDKTDASTSGQGAAATGSRPHRLLRRPRRGAQLLGLHFGSVTLVRRPQRLTSSHAVANGGPEGPQLAGPEGPTPSPPVRHQPGSHDGHRHLTPDPNHGDAMGAEATGDGAIKEDGRTESMQPCLTAVVAAARPEANGSGGPAGAASSPAPGVSSGEGGAGQAPAAQSEYIEEYETVYETETEQADATTPAIIAVAEPGGAGPGVEVNSSLAEVVVGGAALGDSTGNREQTPVLAASTGLPTTSLPLAHVAGYGRLGGTTVGGWALAAALLLAIRLSREAADAERSDLQGLQARQAEGRQLDAELRAKRKAFLEEERRRLEEEAAKRVAEAKARQEEEARLTAERQRLYKEEEAREAQRMKEAQEAARRVYQEREARLAEELAVRAELERRFREEAEAKRKEEAEARKRAEAEAAQRAAEARAAAAAAEAAQRAAEAAARKEMERRLRLASTWYTLVFRGRVTGRPAPAGATVPKSGAAAGPAAATLLRGPPAARLQLECTFGLLRAARTAPTLATDLVALPAPSAAGSGGSGQEDAATVVVEAAEGNEAAAAATLARTAEELGGWRVTTGEGAAAAGAEASEAAAGSGRRLYESAAAAVEGAVELAGAGAAPLVQHLSSPSASPYGWLGSLPLQPPPREALLSAFVTTPAPRKDAIAGPQAPASTASAPTDAAASASAAAAAARSQPQQPSPPQSETVSELAGIGSVSGNFEAEELLQAELRHWARMAHLQLLASGRQACCQLAPLLSPGEELTQDFECRISRQVPPPSSVVPANAAPLLPRSIASSLSYAAGSVAAGRLQVAVDVLNGVISREEAAAASGRDGTANGAALPPLAVAALVYAELMEAAGYQPAPPQPAAADSATAEETQSVPAAAAVAATAAVAGKSGPGSESDSSGDVGAEGSRGGEAGLGPLSGFERLARYQLAERARGAPADSLTPTAQMLRLVLPGGSQHPVCRIVDRLAETNMGIGTRQQLQIRKQRAALEAQAAAVLEQQRGGASGGALVVGPGGPAETRGSLVPIPERLWATRNVANNLLRFGEPLQVGEAVSMLEEAVSIARQHYGERHPCQLAVLLDLLDALAAATTIEGALATGASGAAAGSGSGAGAGAGTTQQPGQGQLTVAARTVKAAEELLEIVQALCERYQAGRDNLSCVLLLEASGSELAPVVRVAGSGSRGVARALSAAMEEAKELVYTLKPPEARVVMTARRDGDLPKLLRRLSRDFTEELGAYAAGKRNRWVDAWTKGSQLPPLRP